MQSKAKLAAFSVSALLAVAIGAYMFADGTKESVSAPTEAVVVASGASGAENTKPVAAARESVGIAPAAAKGGASAEGQKSQPASAASARNDGKLTAEQLTPPAPKTEDEKLQKAAEQEYNRF
jgi:hypothetical protein